MHQLLDSFSIGGSSLDEQSHQAKQISGFSHDPLTVSGEVSREPHPHHSFHNCSERPHFGPSVDTSEWEGAVKGVGSTRLALADPAGYIPFLLTAPRSNWLSKRCVLMINTSVGTVKPKLAVHAPNWPRSRGLLDLHSGPRRGTKSISTSSHRPC